MIKERIDPYLESNLLIRNYHLRRYDLAFNMITKRARKAFKRPLLILDIGCGYGFSALSNSNSSLMLLTDFDADTVKYAKRRYGNRRSDFIVCDAHFIPIRESTIDCLLMLEVIEHLKDPYLAIYEVRRVLKVSGLLFLSTPNAKKPTGNPYHVREFSCSEISEFLSSAGFKISSCKGIVIKRGMEIYSIISSVLQKVLGHFSKSLYVILNNLALFLVNAGFEFPQHSYFVFLSAHKESAH